MVPVTVRSGKQVVVRFRFACDKQLRYAVDQLAWLSLQRSEWARAYYDQQRARAIVIAGRCEPWERNG